MALSSLAFCHVRFETERSGIRICYNGIEYIIVKGHIEWLPCTVKNIQSNAAQHCKQAARLALLPISITSASACVSVSTGKARMLPKAQGGYPQQRALKSNFLFLRAY